MYVAGIAVSGAGPGTGETLGITRAKVPKYLGCVCLNVLNFLIAQRGVTHGL